MHKELVSGLVDFELHFTLDSVPCCEGLRLLGPRNLNQIHSNCQVSWWYRERRKVKGKPGFWTQFKKLYFLSRRPFIDDVVKPDDITLM
jgi:hypothetical protein